MGEGIPPVDLPLLAEGGGNFQTPLRLVSISLCERGKTGEGIPPVKRRPPSLGRKRRQFPDPSQTGEGIPRSL